MQAKVDTNLCAGVGACESTCREMLEVKDGVSTVKVDTVPADAEDRCRQADEGCPMRPISIRSTSQSRGGGPGGGAKGSRCPIYFSTLPHGHGSRDVRWGADFRPRATKRRLAGQGKNAKQTQFLAL